MPFTLAHPVAILPIARVWKRLPLSALVIGSMAPDFPYFLLISNDHYHVGHTRAGLLTFCLPAGFIVLLVFHYILKMPLLSLLNPSQISRLYPVARRFQIQKPLEFFLIVCALVLGAVTHLVLDSFTHRSGWSVRHLPFLASPLPIYKGLQYGGSIGGLWYLYAVYRAWSVRAPDNPTAAQTLQRLLQPSQVLIFLSCLLLLSTAAGLGHSALVFKELGGQESSKKIFADALEAAMSAYAVGLFLFSIAWHVIHHLRRKKN